MIFARRLLLLSLPCLLLSCGATDVQRDEKDQEVFETQDFQPEDGSADLSQGDLSQDQSTPDLVDWESGTDQSSSDTDTSIDQLDQQMDISDQSAVDLADQGQDQNPTDTHPSDAHEGPTCDASLHAGEATYYYADGSGNCSFDASPNDLLVAALNTTDYDTAATCGACIEVQGPAGAVVVRMVDRCPGCSEGDIDLSESAFAEIAALSQGRVNITWKVVPCAVSGPISYHFKDGSNQWWSAVQIRDHINPVAAVHATLDDGSVVALERLNYNFFLYSGGLGPGPYTFEVTDIYGQTLRDSGIPFIEGGVVPGEANFPACH